MKITIEIDCAAIEAREMLGLPDVKKLQENWVKQIDKKLKAEMENYSPEKLLRSWASGAASNLDLLPGLFSTFAQGKTPKE